LLKYVIVKILSLSHLTAFFYKYSAEFPELHLELSQAHDYPHCKEKARADGAETLKFLGVKARTSTSFLEMKGKDRADSGLKKSYFKFSMRSSRVIMDEI
jgi:hypothetical protein